MFNLIGIVISGLVVGLLAEWLYPGEVNLGWIATILLGIGGSLLAGLLASRSSDRTIGGLNRAGCLGSVIGAMVLIFLGRQFL
jgi:uncharacterized membrane protein YeaQ/YmgE (transglycosylase-associated protein family)